MSLAVLCSQAFALTNAREDRKNLFVMALQRDGRTYCSAVQISRFEVLTAAHCIYDAYTWKREARKFKRKDKEFLLERIQKAMKSIRLKAGRDVRPLESVSFESIHLNNLELEAGEAESFYMLSSSLPQDLAKLRFSAPLKNTQMPPVAFYFDVKRSLSLGSDVTLIAFGRPSLQESGSVRRSGKSILTGREETFLRVEGKSKACYGDSGGAVVSFIEGQKKLIGIIVESSSNCSAHSLIERVDRGVDWKEVGPL